MNRTEEKRIEKERGRKKRERGTRVLLFLIFSHSNKGKERTQRKRTHSVFSLLNHRNGRMGSNSLSPFLSPFLSIFRLYLCLVTVLFQRFTTTTTTTTTQKRKGKENGKKKKKKKKRLTRVGSCGRASAHRKREQCPQWPSPA